ncbi:flagellar hook-length control protein FliK [Nesterenkonia massiliensis]|uniref:Flagellar hook-length control protein FliK n=1 Tax=Nesterenkonia massiliensis TaxID=1232429 RepID=A0ABT2HNK3_9MICC|nr:flagellar hook-length control protein FliK [Nesterenkonia massiliensis]MCT1606262.1 flagellar hook-length control protein FliK [Nesterenkonia massiliensis]
MTSGAQLTSPLLTSSSPASGIRAGRAASPVGEQASRFEELLSNAREQARSESARPRSGPATAGEAEPVAADPASTEHQTVPATAHQHTGLHGSVYQGAAPQDPAPQNPAPQDPVHDITAHEAAQDGPAPDTAGPDSAALEGASREPGQPETVPQVAMPPHEAEPHRISSLSAVFPGAELLRTGREWTVGLTGTQGHTTVQTSALGIPSGEAPAQTLAAVESTLTHSVAQAMGSGSNEEAALQDEALPAELNLNARHLDQPGPSEQSADSEPITNSPGAVQGRFPAPVGAHPEAATSGLSLPVNAVGTTSPAAGQPVTAAAEFVPESQITQSQPVMSPGTVPGPTATAAPTPVENPAAAAPLMQPAAAPAEAATETGRMPGGSTTPPLNAQLAGPIARSAAAAALSGGQGQQVLTINVAPENLGPVTVRASLGAEGLRIELFAPHESGREALRAMLTELRRDLAGLGAGTGAVTVSDADAPAGDQHRSDQHRSDQHRSDQQRPDQRTDQQARPDQQRGQQPGAESRDPAQSPDATSSLQPVDARDREIDADHEDRPASGSLSFTRPPSGLDLLA